ncbi:Beta-barrel assembly machine subunit BamA [Breznakibacter xylanolyticus]|uniref:Outer membrane protein assembly factor BamA n=1 Tax=Breznakibacter xylanolyticus TaxID=990 RepID=A0A2W7NGN2_9BACT|nr:outer membrane protein assembly factor BamA [Breznakibacter xylanolyticus]PZX17357.1 Beta-barrel assembly machine subunit BamA [Breznakibacter xylanolyticus]
MQYRISIFFVLAFVLMTLRGFAQESLPNISYSGTPKKYEIADITVVGVQNYDPAILVNLSGLRKGQTISVPGDEITQAIQKYWNHGLFSNAKIVASKIEGRQIWLEIQLSERPRLSEIIYYGLKKGEIETISEKVAMMKGSQVTPFLVNRAEKYIKDHFVEKGFYNTEVKIFQRDDTTKVNHVILEITVDKKEKVKVKTITITGNQIFTARKLDRAMKKTNEKGKILNFFRTKKFVIEKYEEDKVAMIDKYNEKGYRDARVVWDSITRNDDNTVNVRIHVEEGKKYFFGDISWVGNTIYASDYLSQNLKVKKGDVFNPKYLEKRLSTDEDAVSNLYMDNGYLFSSITPVEISANGDTINLEMRVFEGPQATINNVVINGNTKTHEHVVRREIRTKPGQLFSKSELIRTVRELAQLGHFDPEKISPDVQPNQEEGNVDLVYNLEEKANDQIELSGGWGAGMFVGSLGLKFTNFSVRNIFNGEAWRPLPTGDGQTLSLRAQTNGSYYQTYSATFVEPWLGGKKPNSLSLSVYYSKMTSMSSSMYGSYYSSYYGNQQEDDRFMKVFGASIGYGKRLTWPDDFFTIYAELGYQYYSLKDWTSMFISDGKSNVITLGLTLSRNSLDNPLYTRSGSNFSIGTKFTPPFSLLIDKDYNTLYKRANDGTSTNASKAKTELYQFVEYHKWSFKGEMFKPLDNRSKLVLRGKVEGGFLGYYNESTKSPFEKYYVGGDGMSGYSMYGSETVGVRGYENSSLTPINNTGQYDGNMYTKMTMELRYPITLQPSATVYALAFAESGNAWTEFKDYNPFNLYRSAGVGLRIFLPIFGLMGIDWGYGFDEVAGRPTANGSQFHFVIGQSF